MRLRIQWMWKEGRHGEQIGSKTVNWACGNRRCRFHVTSLNRQRKDN